MASDEIVVWKSNSVAKVPDNMSDPKQIAAFATQLRQRERTQIATNFEAENYEIAASFTWMRAMALLKNQLGLLGMEFIGELLQRPDISGSSDVQVSVSDAEAISLARDLGVLTSTQALRFLQSQAVISHFSSLDITAGDEDEYMTREEAIICLRVCVQAILGQESVAVAEDFKKFREKLSQETLTADSAEIAKLRGSPYFFLRTAVSVLLSTVRSAKGAQLEHASRNAILVVVTFWTKLKESERWQIGQAYAAEFNEGNSGSIRCLNAILTAVHGFDYVPESLRSGTFTEVAAKVIRAHQGSNNFYNEPAPMRELASLGTSIPGPALSICFTAILCVRLGNLYGVSWAAQEAADEMISSISIDRWMYYVSERLLNDRVILAELTSTGPAQRWCALIKEIGLEVPKNASKGLKVFLEASVRNDFASVQKSCQHFLRASLGAK